MTDKEYLEKYGEEALLKRKENRRIYHKKYYDANKDYVLSKTSEYRQTHQEKIKEFFLEYNKTEKRKDLRRQYNKKYRETNPDKCKESSKKYYSNNKEAKNEYCKSWAKSNPERVKQSRYKHYHSINGRALALSKSYIKRDAKRGMDISNNIDKEWIVDNIFSGQKCVYCGDNNWEHLGCDRIDNSKPHTPENCVCACLICNTARGTRYSVEEFKKYRSIHPVVNSFSEEVIKSKN